MGVAVVGAAPKPPVFAPKAKGEAGDETPKLGADPLVGGGPLVPEEEEAAFCWPKENPLLAPLPPALLSDPAPKEGT